MKKLLIIASIMTVMCVCAYGQNYYMRNDCVVVSVDNNTTTFKDETGNLWIANDTDFEVGQIVTLRMDDNNTEHILTDDKIIEIFRD